MRDLILTAAIILSLWLIIKFCIYLNKKCRKMNNGVYGLRPTFSNESATDLTKREYFAAVALQGIMSNPEINPSMFNVYRELSQKSVELADHLIKALNDNPSK